jgi:hypothetical protein
MGETCSRYGRHDMWSENVKGRNHLGNVGVDERIILNWIFGWKVWIGFSWLRKVFNSFSRMTVLWG